MMLEPRQVETTGRAIFKQLSAFSCQLSARSSQLSAILIILLILPFLAPVSCQRAPDSSRGSGNTQAVQVAWVADGDTIKLESGERVRLLGIDAPERGAPLHEEARKACRDLLQGRRVVLEKSRSRDRYGRILALVHSGELLVNEEILLRGLALVYLKSKEEMSRVMEQRLIRAQNVAMDQRRGLWSSPGALSDPPGVKLLATRRRFHRTGCTSLLESGARGTATTREKALRSGKSPCRTCLR